MKEKTVPDQQQGYTEIGWHKGQTGRRVSWCGKKGGSGRREVEVE